MLQNRTTWIIAGVAFCLGMLVTALVTCHSAPVESPAGSPATIPIPVGIDSIIHAPATHDTLREVRYIRGASYTTPDTSVQESRRVDTIKYTYDHYDTIIVTRLAPPALGPAIPSFHELLADFAPQGHLLELRASADHDLLKGGYGGALALQLNLDKIHLVNIQPYVAIGYRHDPYFTIGVSGTLYGKW